MCPHMSHNMVNFGPLAAEICWRVWGTPAHFNGFRVLAALLHSTLQWASAKLCGVEQRAPPIYGKAAITLGIGPHSSFYCRATNMQYICTARYKLWSSVCVSVTRRCFIETVQ